MKKYYFIEVELQSKKIKDWGIVDGEEMFDYAQEKNYRIFLPKGQYNKFVRAMKA